MNNKKKYRRYKFLVNELSGIINTGVYLFSEENDLTIKGRIKTRIKQYKNLYGDEIPKHPTPYYKETQKLIELDNLINELNISEDDILDAWMEVVKRKNKTQEEFSQNGAKETRDNKNVKVMGSGNYNKNPIRYPSLKRSKATWKRFYRLFPNAGKRVKI